MGGGEFTDAPPDLPYLDLREWVRTHPAKSYYPDQPMSTGEILTTGGIAVGLEILGHVIKRLHPITWLHLLWEGLVHQAERDELPERRRQAQLAAFRAYMWEKFWSDESLYPSSAAREGAFDRFVGDNASHGIVPALTQEAEVRRQELINQINDRWLAEIETYNDLAQRLETLEASKPDLATSEEHKRNVAQAAEIRQEAAELRRLADIPNSRRWVRDPNTPEGGYTVAVDRGWALDHASYLETQARNLETAVEQRWAIPTENARKALESHQAAMVNSVTSDVKVVTDFESNPGNWELTAEQKAMVACETTP